MEQLKMPDKFDYTMLSTYLTCKKKYWLRMVRGFVGKVSPTAVEFGKCIHQALDEWYMSKDKSKVLEMFNSTFKENPEDDKRTIAVGNKLLSLYMEKYEGDRFKVLASELYFEVPLPSPVPDQGFQASLIGRIDKIIDWDGVVYIMDHKTTSRLGYEFFNKIKPNMQFDGYIYAARKLGYPAQGILLDALLVAKGLVIPSQLVRLTPLARDISTRTDDELAVYISNIQNILEDIHKAYTTNTWYMNTESCCDFVECPYRKVCKEDMSLQERILEMDYTVDHWDPKEKEGVSGKV